MPPSVREASSEQTVSWLKHHKYVLVHVKSQPGVPDQQRALLRAEALAPTLPPSWGRSPPGAPAASAPASREGRAQTTVPGGFTGQARKWPTSLLPLLHWLGFGHKATPNCKGGWEMQSGSMPRKRRWSSWSAGSLRHGAICKCVWRGGGGGAGVITEQSFLSEMPSVNLQLHH